jgi:hypothetical protein
MKRQLNMLHSSLGILQLQCPITIKWWLVVSHLFTRCRYTEYFAGDAIGKMHPSGT